MESTTAMVRSPTGQWQWGIDSDKESRMKKNGKVKTCSLYNIRLWHRFRLNKTKEKTQ